MVVSLQWLCNFMLNKKIAQCKIVLEVTLANTGAL